MKDNLITIKRPMFVLIFRFKINNIFSFHHFNVRLTAEDKK
jgi:hypothetical protein